MENRTQETRNRNKNENKDKVGFVIELMRLRKEFQESPTRSVKGALNQEIALGNIG